MPGYTSACSARSRCARPPWTGCALLTASSRAGSRPSCRSSARPPCRLSTTSRSTEACASRRCWTPRRSPMPENGRRSTREQVLDELRSAEKLIAVTHENPDGDALGSLVAMTMVLQALGKDCRPFIDERELPLPREYEFLATDGLLSAPPDDLEERTVVFLDCGNLERNAAKAFRHPGMRTVNIDHHHDNTMFGSVNLVEPEASSTAEIVWDLLHGLGVTLTRPIAEALYVGLITDTGRFMYENASPRAHRMAAELLEAGVEAHTVYRQVYENVPYGKLALLARGLAK